MSKNKYKQDTDSGKTIRQETSVITTKTSIVSSSGSQTIAPTKPDRKSVV